MQVQSVSAAGSGTCLPSGRLNDIVQRVRQVLLPGGCIVFNSVSAQSYFAFKAATEQAGMTMMYPTRVVLNEYNPIDILKSY